MAGSSSPAETPGAATTKFFRIYFPSQIFAGTYRIQLWLADGKVVLDLVQSAANTTVSEYSPSADKLTLASDGIVATRFQVEPLPANLLA